MAEYKVNTNLRHNGKKYSPGDKIKLDDEVAERLIANQTISGEVPKKGKGK